MAHFLLKDEARAPWALGKPWAAVRVRVIGLRPTVLQIDPEEERPILILTADTQMVHLPERVKLIGQDGEEVPSTGRFAVTIESFNPFHAVADLF